MKARRLVLLAGLLAGCGAGTTASTTTVTTAAAAPAVAATPPDPATSEPIETEVQPGAPIESTLAAFAPDPVPRAESDRVRALLRSRMHGTVTVIGGVPGDDPGVLATVLIHPVASEEEGEEEEPLGDCETTRLVRVVADANGSLRVVGELHGVCPRASGEDVRQGDVDGDGRLELVFTSRIVRYTSSDSRSGAGAEAGSLHRVVITDTALRPQAEWVRDESYEDTEGGEPDPRGVTRATLTENAQGHRDLVLDTRHVSAFCTASDPWSLSENDDENDDEDDEEEADDGCYPEDTREVRRYDATADRWVAE